VVSSKARRTGALAMTSAAMGAGGGRADEGEECAAERERQAVLAAGD